MSSSKKSNRGRRMTSITPANNSIQISIPRSNGSTQPKKRRQKRKNRVQRPSVSRGDIVKPCTLRYMNALLDPWTSITQDEMPCVPDMYAMPSFKFCSRIRGTCFIGTQGFGYVALSPFNANNDNTSLAVTTAAFAGTACSPITDAGLSSLVDAQIPWLGANSPLVRLVACGIRVKYSGTELNRGGIIVPMRAMGSQDNLTATNGASVLQRQDHSPEECDRKWHGSVFTPCYPSAYEFSVSLYPINGAGSVASSFKQGVLFTGTAGQSYFFDLVRYWEVITNDTNPAVPTFTPPGMSRSHSDLDGLGMVRDFVGELTASDQGQAVLQQGYAFLKRSAIGVAGNLIGGSLGGPAANLLQWK